MSTSEQREEINSQERSGSAPVSTSDAAGDDSLSKVIVTLMKGVFYRETDSGLWQQLLNLQARVRDYVAVLGLTLMLDEAEGYAWLHTREAAEGETPPPRLVARRQLSYPVSLIIALLRRKLAESDAGGGDTRLILSRDDVVEMVRTFLPAGTNEARLVDQIEAHLNKIVDLGFIRRLRGQAQLIEVRRILKAFVDAQWLSEFDDRLKNYRTLIAAPKPLLKRRGLMRQELLDFAASDTLAGFRLKRLEIYNWGTFHDRVWTLHLNGCNSLLTGDIGSGKSTLVDAVTTLLVPAQRIAYNKAAGADSRERSLRSYVFGFYKSERSEAGQSAKPVALRDHNSYSVILGEFHNAGYSQEITLAQVLWHKDVQGQPGRFYVVADRSLTIAAHFARFGSDLNQLRKRLRAAPGVELFDSFPPYAALFRRRFGIGNEQALELFLQTVSMKSVGNLTAFVREHMLEAADVQPRIDALIGHFDDLNRAHAAVLKAKRQIERLTPLSTDCAKHRNILQQSIHLRACRDGLRVYFADLKADLLTRRLKILEDEQNLLLQQIERLAQVRREQLGSRDQLKQAIAENGGDRIERLKAEIQEKTRQKTRRKERAGRYRELALQVELPEALTIDTFVENRNRIEALLGDLAQQEAEFQNAHTEGAVRLQGFKQQHEALCAEIESLRQRRSNIDSKQIRIRGMLCEALRVDETDMPFAGELIQVKAEESDWEGAAERLLHNFGLSLLVPERLYPTVAEWVDRTHLQGRLVYFRVRDKRTAGALNLHPQSLAGKLAVKPDSEFYYWLENELGRRYDFACCQSLEQFYREQQAITRAGQIKSGGRRHEKDDRHPLDDRSRYVLGWSNEHKIAALVGRAEHLEQAMQAVADKLADLQQRLQQVAGRKTALVRLGELRDFNEMDWQALARAIADLEAEKQALEAASNVLHTLGRQLADLEAAIAESEATLDTRKKEHARNEEKQQQAGSQLGECRAIIAETARGRADRIV